MKIQIFAFTILVAVNSSSCHPPTRHVLEPAPESIPKNYSVTGPNCVAVVHRDTHSILRTRMKRSQIRKVSLSPESAPPPYISPGNSTISNTTQPNTNATLPTQQPSPTITSWIPTLEKIVTPIFRAVILILTLFNVNITWRIHAFHVGHRPLRHHNRPAGRGWPV